MKESHLIYVFQFVYDLIYHRICSFHFDFGVGSLSLDPTAHHTEGVAVNKVQKTQLTVFSFFSHVEKNNSANSTLSR